MTDEKEDIVVSASGDDINYKLYIDIFSGIRSVVGGGVGGCLM